MTQLTIYLRNEGNITVDNPTNLSEVLRKFRSPIRRVIIVRHDGKVNGESGVIYLRKWHVSALMVTES